jgi:hypothetical protein
MAAVDFVEDEFETYSPVPSLMNYRVDQALLKANHNNSLSTLRWLTYLPVTITPISNSMSIA